MKRTATIILVSISINYVLLVASILLHDKRSVYKSIRIGDPLPAAYLLNDYTECSVPGEDRQQVRCRFDDFWNVYTFVIRKGVVTEKAYRNRTDLASPRLPLLPREHRNWWFTALSIFVISAVVGSAWFLLAGPKQSTEFR